MKDLATREDMGGFGLPQAVEQGKPALVGGGAALGIAAACRGFGPAGSWIEKRAGTLGGLGGVVVSLVAKQGGAAIAAALLVGLAVEGIEYLTAVKMAG